MDDERRTIKVRILNHLTGEITDIEVNSADQAKNLYVELAASATAINKAKDALRNYLDEFLGNDEKYQFVDGKILRRVQRMVKSYRVEQLREYLDEDQISVVLKVDMPAARELLQDMQERGELPPGTLKKIESEADVNASKPFVEIR